MSRKTSIEDFIRDHRQEFDDLQAPSRIWKRIEGKSTQVHAIWKWTAVAASALLLVATGYIFGSRSVTSTDIAGWKEYQETEQYYESRIQEKMEKIKTLAVGDEVMADIQILDDVYHQLKTQLMEDPNANTEILLSAMIRHQQQKLEVMEEILNRVDKYRSNETEGHEM